MFKFTSKKSLRKQLSKSESIREAGVNLLSDANLKLSASRDRIKDLAEIVDYVLDASGPEAREQYRGFGLNSYSHNRLLGDIRSVRAESRVEKARQRLGVLAVLPVVDNGIGGEL